MTPAGVAPFWGWPSARSDVAAAVGRRAGQAAMKGDGHAGKGRRLGKSAQAVQDQNALDQGVGLAGLRPQERIECRQRVVAAVEVGEQAMKAVDTGRQRAASGLSSAADKLHQTADRLPGGPRVSRAAHKTADGLGATANYLGENSFGDMLSDVGDVVKAHPTQALLAALAVGFLVGRAMRRS